MTFVPMTVSLPIADRATSYHFYRDGLGLDAVGELADDGLPEPLQFVVNDGLRLMLVPTGGFGWVIGRHEVAARGQSECVLSLGVASSADADADRRAGARRRRRGGHRAASPTLGVRGCVRRSRRSPVDGVDRPGVTFRQDQSSDRRIRPAGNAAIDPPTLRSPRDGTRAAAAHRVGGGSGARAGALPGCVGADREIQCRRDGGPGRSGFRGRASAARTPTHARVGRRRGELPRVGRRRGDRCGGKAGAQVVDAPADQPLGSNDSRCVTDPAAMSSAW